MSKFKAGQFWRSRGEGNYVLDEVEDHCIRGHRVSDNMKVAWFPDGQLHPGKKTAYDLMAMLPEATTGPREIHDPEYDGSNDRLVSITVRVPWGYEVSGPDSGILAIRHDRDGKRIAAHCPIVSIEPVDAPKRDVTPVTRDEFGGLATEVAKLQRHWFELSARIDKFGGDAKQDEVEIRAHFDKRVTNLHGVVNETVKHVENLPQRLDTAERTIGRAFMKIDELRAELEKATHEANERLDRFAIELAGKMNARDPGHQNTATTVRFTPERIEHGWKLPRPDGSTMYVYDRENEWINLDGRSFNLSFNYTIGYDGFTGTIIGSYRTREGKAGVVLQQIGTKVVHVYKAEHLQK